MYQYKCLISSMGVELGKKQTHADVGKLYESFLNEQANEGWEFIGVDQINSRKPAGCFSALFGIKYERQLVKVTIFRKAI